MSNLANGIFANWICLRTKRQFKWILWYKILLYVIYRTPYDNENAIADEQIVWGTTFEFYLK